MLLLSSTIHQRKAFYALERNSRYQGLGQSIYLLYTKANNLPPFKICSHLLFRTNYAFCSVFFKSILGEKWCLVTKQSIIRCGCELAATCIGRSSGLQKVRKFPIFATRCATAFSQQIATIPNKPQMVSTKLFCQENVQAKRSFRSSYLYFKY